MTLHPNPILTVLGIIGVVALLGYIISYFRSSVNFSGYQELAADAQSVARAMKAEIFRDGEDLVVSGNYGKLPAIVRFSYADNTPGLNIRMRAPATFMMTVVPKGVKASEGRIPVRTADEMFDARFITRSDHPTQARMFLSGKQTLARLQKLCCSPKTFLTISSGSLELSELVIPTPYTGRHISGHLDSMAQLAEVLGEMPGAHEVKIAPYERERNHLITAAIAVLAITGVLVVAGAVHERSSAANTGGSAEVQKIPEGVSLSDAAHIRALDGWRVATSDDFDPDAVGWARAQGAEEVSGHISGNFGGSEERRDAAYIFISQTGAQAGKRRVVMMVDNGEKLDAGYLGIAVAGRVSRDNFDGIQWQGKPPAQPPDGDGLLIVRKADDPASGVIYYLSGGQIATAVPANYQNVSVE